jgi:membrane protein
MTPRVVFGLLKRTYRDWRSDGCPTMAAALSYYTIFSIPPLLVLVLMVTGVVLDPADVEGRIGQEIGRLIGPEGAAQIREIIRNAERPEIDKTVLSLVGFVGLLLGASGALSELQQALNRAWEVAPDPTQTGWLRKLGKRAISLAMLITLGFLLLVSLVVSAVLSAFGARLGLWLPEGLSESVLRLLNAGVSLGVITVLFAVIFKFMPDARIRWRDVGVGAVGTALLFTGGKLVIGEYLAHSDPGQAFGAAGSLALVLVWVYYTSMIVLFGAEFTQVWAEARGAPIIPDEGAIRVLEPPDPGR